MKAALALFALVSCVATAAAVDSDAVNNPFDPATDSLAEWLRATRRSNFAARLSDLYEVSAEGATRKQQGGERAARTPLSFVWGLCARSVPDWRRNHPGSEPSQAEGD
jgi:hypothetical protein